MEKLFFLGIFVLVVISYWKVFEKAGKPGWASIIPIYNAYILLVIAQKPWWWLLLMFIPIANIVVTILLSLEIAKRFQKGSGFGIGLFFLPFVFYPILAFGDARYIAGDSLETSS
jgi:hypothetical protein